MQQTLSLSQRVRTAWHHAYGRYKLFPFSRTPYRTSFFCCEPRFLRYLAASVNPISESLLPARRSSSPERLTSDVISHNFRPPQNTQNSIIFLIQVLMESPEGRGLYKNTLEKRRKDLLRPSGLTSRHDANNTLSCHNRSLSTVNSNLPASAQ